MREYLDLFLTFFKIGAFTFGGGYAMISVIEDLCVEKKGWITHEDMMTITIIAESTPGPVAINCATFVGARRKGAWGALCATLGVIVPSFLVILAIASFLDRFLDIPIVANAFRGIKVAVGILIFNAAVNMIRKMKKTPFGLTVLALAAAAMLAGNLMAVHISSVVLMVFFGVLGFALTYRKRGGGRL